MIDPEYKNRQADFNAVWEHFIVQKNPRARGSDFVCAYRMDDGSKCAVGVILPDELYDPLMDKFGLTATDLDDFSRSIANAPMYDPMEDGVATNSPELQEWTEAHDLEGLLSDLQWAHDGVLEPFHENFEAELRVLAEKYNLTIPTSTAEEA